MPQNTIFNPEHVDLFLKSKLEFCGKSISGECSENETTHVDLELTDDCLMTGGILLVKNAKFGDKVSLQIVHPVYGVIKTFVDEYAVVEDTQKQFDIALAYPAKLPTGLKIRAEYKSNDTIVTREFSINLYLHKVLE